MTQQLNEITKTAIQDILKSQNTNEKARKFNLYKELLKNCRIFLFDEKYSNVDCSFSNCKIGQCEIIGVADYKKTWILDSHHILNSSYIAYGKTIEFDLNILTYLNKIMTDQKIGIDKTEFLKYLNYIKKQGFQYGIITALLERVTTQIDFNILAEMITSFVKFDNMKEVIGDCADFYLPPEEYTRIKQLYDLALKKADKTISQFDFICCCVMKAYIIKTYDTDTGDRKVEKFIKFCLEDLKCYLEKEIVLLSLYILNDNHANRTFKSLKKNSDIIKNILNVTWDIYQIRLVEQIMLHDNANKDHVILSYFATADKGLIEAMKINPLKAFVIIGNISISFHQMTIQDVCKNEKILKDIMFNSKVREKSIRSINLAEIRNVLKQEIISKAKL